MLGQNVLERPGQNLLQLLHLGLHGFELRFTLQRGSGFFGLCSGVFRQRHAAIGIELGNGEI